MSDHSAGSGAERAHDYSADHSVSAGPSARRKRPASANRPQDHRAGAEEASAYQTDAFDHLYRTRYQQLLRIARARTGNHADAADLVHDAFLRTKRAYSDKGVDDLWPLLLTTLKNLTSNHLKSADAKRQRRSVDLWDIDETLACARGVTPEKQTIDSQLLGLVSETIEGMTPRRQKALRMHRYEGRTYDDIARELSVSKTTVKDDVAKAVAELTRTLARGRKRGK